MYRAIVVGTDGSPSARGAVIHAGELAKATGAKLHIVCVMRPAVALVGAPELVMPVDTAGEADAVRAILDDASRDVAPHGIAVETHSPVGSPASCLIDVAASIDADLLVVGSRGLHGARRILGSVPNSVTHHAPCHVLVVQTG